MTARSNTTAYLFGASLMAMACAAPNSAAAKGRTYVSPYLELNQSVVADISGGNGDVLTYTNAAVGVEAGVVTQRAEAQIDLRYEHQQAWGKKGTNSDSVSGIAKARYQVMRDTLSVEAGALATAVRTDGYTGANNSLAGAGDNKSEVYSAYVGPTFTSNVGEMEVKAAYRLGYTKVNDGASVLADGLDVGGSTSSTSHYATASVGMQPGALPVGWAVGVGYEREDGNKFDSRYENRWGRADVTVPVSGTLAAVGGVGYESIKNSQRGVTTDANGNYVVNSASPRVLAYDESGVFWDAGVMWRPSSRTSAEARVGHRYGSMSYTGSFIWQASENTSLAIGLFDQVDSFGRSIQRNLNNLPTSFNAYRNPFSGELTGCVQGDQGGTCLNDNLAGISALNYRNRGITALYSHHAGPWNWGVGAGYSQRKYIAPSTGVLASINGNKDQNYFANLFAGKSLDEQSSLSGAIYGNYFIGGVSDDKVTNVGANATYSRTFGRRLSANASVGVDSVKKSDIDAVISGLAQVGMRYQF
jgi:hypothetical protein